MATTGTAADRIPEGATLAQLQRAAADCTACDLHRTGSQTVFGHGPADADLILVGEQPGDLEDREGLPFVGPAGRELDRALEAVGLGERPHLRTNVVKHFKWEGTRGKRRIHAKPNALEVAACLPWLHAEIDATRPEVLVTLGATAAKAVLGNEVRITRDRGGLHRGPRGALVTATVHPSSILRAGDARERRQARAAFHDDLRVAAALVLEGPASALRLLTLERLRERARSLDVRGRSTMDKATLASAVAEALQGG